MSANRRVNQITRRSFIKSVGQVSIASGVVGSLSLVGNGCDSKSQDHVDRELLRDVAKTTDTAGKAISTLGALLVPVIPAEGVADVALICGAVLQLAADGIQRYSETFKPGEVVEPRKQHEKSEKAPVAKIANIETIQTSFAAKGEGKKFASPIVNAASRNKLIFQASGGRDHYSIIWDNLDGAFFIHNDWFEWLLNVDSCSFTVVEDTWSGPCAFCEQHDQNIKVVSQRLRHMGGKEEVLVMVDEDEPDPQALEFHLGHTRPFIPCKGGGAPNEKIRFHVEAPANTEDENGPSSSSDSEPDDSSKSDTNHDES